jgi:prepilin-type N-terminal cleavage/methylation domain-containing protein
VRKPSTEAGFTLLELIISLTILGLMAGLVFSSLRLALNSYDRSQVRLEEEATRRVLFDHLKRQIGSLFPLLPTAGFVVEQVDFLEGEDPLSQFARSQTPLFFGEPTSVTFITLAPLLMTENPGLTVVRYGLAQDEYGDFYLGAMETSYIGQESFLLMAGTPQGKPIPIVEGIERLDFEYYGFDPIGQTWAWFAGWSGEEMQGVPRAIRINFDDEYLIVPVNASFFGNNLRTAIQNVLGRSPQLDPGQTR